MIKLILTLLVFVGCIQEEPVVRLNTSQCVLTCVKNIVYPLDSVGGENVKSIHKVCENAMKGRTCCSSPHLYMYPTPCDEIKQ